ncbi:tetratricopeptide repeat protein [bacterium]|nr:tetratricopeptide repeat protein [bacterium]
MNSRPVAWLLGASLMALSACAGVGPSVFGASGCKTIYVFRGDGGVQPVSSCADLPRDTLVAGAAGAADVAANVSANAQATAPHDPLPADAGPDQMIEAGDLSTFMARIRSDHAADANAGAWGFAVIDGLAAGDVGYARTVFDGMAEQRRQPETLGADFLKPWVLAAGGEPERAIAAMNSLRNTMPPVMLRSQLALLLEGMGDLNAALAAYEDGPDVLEPPGPEDAARPDYLIRLLNYSFERKAALRHAEFLRSIKRDRDAIAVLDRLAAADPDDGYIALQLRNAKEGAERTPVRSLNAALAVALGDQADSIDERQGLLGAVMARGTKPPFNHLVSALRQSALVLDPNNGPVRLTEVNNLHAQGKFSSALRLAQIGDPPRDFAAELLIAASKSALELGSMDAVEGLVAAALSYDSGALSKLSAAEALASAGNTDRAIDLIDEALKAKLSDRERVFAVISKSDAHFQAGNVPQAVKYARDAVAIDDSENTQQYLASMLVKTPDREEGLNIMRQMLAKTPTNTGLMNNLGYSLIDDHASETELEEGFKLLKEASRLAPYEPNLLDSIGWAYYLYGDFREARRYLERAIEAFAPFSHWELHDHMGDVQWRLGETEAARESWRESLSARPPKHRREGIEAKLRSGLTTPAPALRATPEVPLSQSEKATEI